MTYACAWLVCVTLHAGVCLQASKLRAVLYNIDCLALGILCICPATSITQPYSTPITTFVQTPTVVVKSPNRPTPNTSTNPQNAVLHRRHHCCFLCRLLGPVPRPQRYCRLPQRHWFSLRHRRCSHRHPPLQQRCRRHWRPGHGCPRCRRCCFGKSISHQAYSVSLLTISLDDLSDPSLLCSPSRDHAINYQKSDELFPSLTLPVMYRLCVWVGQHLPAHLRA